MSGYGTIQGHDRVVRTADGFLADVAANEHGFRNEDDLLGWVARERRRFGHSWRLMVTALRAVAQRRGQPRHAFDARVRAMGAPADAI